MSNRHPAPAPLDHQYEVGLLAEEAGEVVQIIGKTLRHGYDSYNPYDAEQTTNLDLIHTEVGDFLGATTWAVERGVLDEAKLEAARVRKHKKLQQIGPDKVQPYNPLGRKPRQILMEAEQPAEPLLPSTGWITTNDGVGVVTGSKVSLDKNEQKAAAIVLVAFFVLLIGTFFGASHFGHKTGYAAGKHEVQTAAAEESRKCFAERAEAMGVTEVNVGDCEILARLGNVSLTNAAPAQ